MNKTNTYAFVVLGASLLLGAGVYQSSNAAEKETEQAKMTKNMESHDKHLGEKVYKTYCMACHVTEGRPSIAPPIFAVKNHVLAEFPEREDFIKRVTEWVKAPNQNEALMPGAIRKFGLMPALAMKDADLQAVAAYLYDADMNLPDWYSEHYEAEHGQKPK